MPLRIGHRGAAGTHPENTMAAFSEAVRLGADGVELDVHRTADGHLIVMHDPTIDRTTSGKGIIMALTLAEIQRHDAGSWMGGAFAGQRVPTLVEVIRGTPPQLKLFVELKAGSLHYPGIEAQLLQVIKEEKAQDRVQISSFDHHALSLLRDLDSDQALGMLFAANLLDPVGMALAVGAQALHPTWEWVTPVMVEAARDAGLKVNAWTANLPLIIAHLRAIGVDGIMSDYPSLL